MELKETGWDGLGRSGSRSTGLASAERVAAISQEARLPVAGVCGQGWNFVNDPVVFEINCRRIEFAAAVGADALRDHGAGPARRSSALGRRN